MDSDIKSVLIAHGDPEIRAFLEENIRFRELKIRLAGTASDGTQLLRMTGEAFPDFFIISILFFMQHGAALAKMAATKNRVCTFVVAVDGEALSLSDLYTLPFRVDFFLQLPLTKDELHEKLTLVTRALANGTPQETDEPEYYKLYRSVQNLFLLRTLRGERVPASAEAVGREYGITLK